MTPKKNPGLIELLEKVKETNFRAVLLLIGPFSKYQVPEIHYKWSKLSSQMRSPTLWCYKNHKPFPFSDTLKRNTKVGEKWKTYLNFFNQTKIKFCFHDQTSQILGETFGMCVLEDLEMISPNTLARVIETIEGGGLIIFLLNTKNQIKNLDEISSQTKQKFKITSYKTWTGRFFDILLFSLHECPTFLALDEKLNVLKRKNKGNFEEFFNWCKKKREENGKRKNLLYELVRNIQKMEPLGSLVSKTKTFDQARAFLTFSEAIATKKNSTTILLTSPRGRGKSAVLGLSSASAFAYGCGNIFVTAPSPENLHSFFAFLFIGFKLLNYRENFDFEIIQNTKLKFIEKIKIFSTHHQELNFLFPHEVKEKKNQIELLIIDEAAAIPEEDFKTLLGPYNIFASSTTSGYEGSGRTFCIKMLNSIKNFHFSLNSKKNLTKSRVLKEILLEEPIRYSENDPVEKWLNGLLCLDPIINPVFLSGCPDPKICKLFLVDRNALFSGHKVSRCFVQKIFNLFASSHYRNSPDDLQLLCDAPSHRILILIPPFNFSIGFLPDLLCAIHISYEGQISRVFIQKFLLKGKNISGDLIPWVLSKYHLDSSFAELSGIRIIRIATHPDIQNMGYGTRALKLLQNISSGKSGSEKETKIILQANSKKFNPPRISPVLINLNEKKFLNLDYIGVSFGLSHSLLGFWRKNGFRIVFLQNFTQKGSAKQICIMLNPCNRKKVSKPVWFKNFRREFSRKFLNLLGLDFRSIPVTMAYSIIENAKERSEELGIVRLNVKKFLTPFDFNRLFFFIEKDAMGLKLVSDILPTIAKLSFWSFFVKKNFSYLENLIIIGIGFQNKTVAEIKKELSLKSYLIVRIIKNYLIKVIKNF